MRKSTLLFMMASTLFGASSFLMGLNLNTSQKHSASPSLAEGPTQAERALRVATNLVQAKNQAIEFTVVGQAVGAKTVNIQAQVSGQLLSQEYQDGAGIQAGDLLFQLDPAPFELSLLQMSAQLDQNRAQSALSAKELQRQRDLFKKNATSSELLDQAISTHEAAESLVKAQEAQVENAKLNLSYTKITAPVAGLSTSAAVSIGSLVQAGSAGTLLATLTQTDPIWINFSLSENELAETKEFSAERLASIEVLDHNNQLIEVGQLSYVSSQLDPTLASMKLRAQVANPQMRIKPGQFVRVRLKIKRDHPVYPVPQQAVLQENDQHYVFIKNADNRAEKRTIAVAEWLGTHWLVKDGLAPDDEVVVDNIIKLRPGVLLHSVAPPS